MSIKIEKNLSYFSTFDPTKESKPVSLGNLCKDIEENNITIPIFQTYIRWTITKSVELLNFQLCGKAAVSPISINIIDNIETAVQQVKFLSRIIIDKAELKGKHSVNDGQQRLTCNYKAYINHDDFRCIVLDISKGRFIVNTEKFVKSQIPVGVLYNKDPKVFQMYLKNHNDLHDFDVQSLLTNIRSKFLSYYYVVNYARDLSREEQIKWFDVLNLAGSRVTGVMVQLTEMLIKGVDYYKEYSEVFFEILREADLEKLFKIKDTQISIPLAALNPAYEMKMRNGVHKDNFAPFASDAKARVISGLDGSIIKDIFKATLESLNSAIAFIDEYSLPTPKRIDYLTYLAGVFSFNRGSLNTKQKEYLKSWYSNTTFTNLVHKERRRIFSDLVVKIEQLSH